MPFTFHSHSGQFCRHAKGNLENVVKKAIECRMLVIGLSEHVPRSQKQDLYPEESDLQVTDLHAKFDDYVKEARHLQEKYKGQIKILVGAETEFIREESLAEAKSLRQKYLLDYIVGSVHHICEIPLDFDNATYECIVEKFGGNRTAMFKEYFNAQYRMLQELKPEVIGHFDLVRIFHPYNKDTADPIIVSQEVRMLVSRNIEFAISYGALFEINSRAWKKGLPDAYPQRDILQEILNKGGKVTLSDDSHGEQDIAMHYDKLYAYLAKIGIKDLHYLEPGKTIGTSVVCVLKDGAHTHDFWTTNGFV